MITVKNLDTTGPITVGHYPAPKADYVCVDTSEKGNGREAVYQFTGGSEETPASVRVGWYPNPKFDNGFGQTNISIKFSTYAEKEVDSTIVWSKPLSVTLAASFPGIAGFPDEGDLIAAIHHCMSWLIPNTAGVPQETALAELKFGVVNVLNGHADS